jgi:transposase
VRRSLCRIEKLFAIEREINGLLPEQRLAVRHERSKKIVYDLEQWLWGERKKLTTKGPLAQAIDYSFNHWRAFTRVLDDDRICLSNNAAERALRSVAVFRRNWIFCGSHSGADIDPRAWFADVLARIADHPARRIVAVDREDRLRCTSGAGRLIIRRNGLARAIP